MILILGDPEIKIADVFLMLAENMNINIAETMVVEFKITSEEVANWAGMDKAVCNQILGRFAKQNRITISTGKITVNNMNDFFRIVNSKRRSMNPHN